MERIPSPLGNIAGLEQPPVTPIPSISPTHAGERQDRQDRQDHRVETRPDSRLVDDGRERMRSGSATVNSYDIDDIHKAYAPTMGYGTKEQVAKEIDFNFKTYETYGKRDYAMEREHYNQGWRTVQYSDFPDRFAPAGTEGPVLVKDMILMWRPMRLTVQARNEEIQRATRAMQVHRLKMAEAPEGQAPRTTPIVRSSREGIPIEIPD